MAEKKSSPKKEADFEVQITEVTIISGKVKNIRITINDRTIMIPVSEAVYAYWNEQFIRPNPTAHQRKRLATLMNIVKAAYVKGLEDGGNATRQG